jgi:hypothetical protein
MAPRALVVLALVACTCACAGCDRGRPSPSSATDASGRREVTVRVPGALMIARAIDSVSVSIDATSLAGTTVLADPALVMGVETECFVFPMGQPPPAPAIGRHGFTSSADFDVGTSTWNSKVDGLPVQGIKYVAEMRLVLFQTDVRPGRSRDGWDPHAGKFEALWTRTLRQAEE